MFLRSSGTPRSSPGATRLAAALALLVVSILTAASTHAQTVTPKTLAQLVGEAEQIFVGTVTAMQSRRLPTGLIVTDVTFAVDRVLKGELLDRFVLQHMGGTVDDVTLSVRGAPEFRVGARYVAFVTGNGRSAMPLVGGEQGVFQVAPSRSGGADVVLSARGLWLPNAAVLGLPSPPVAAMHDPGAPLTLPVFLDAISSGLAR